MWLQSTSFVPLFTLRGANGVPQGWLTLRSHRDSLWLPHVHSVFSGCWGS